MFKKNVLIFFLFNIFCWLQAKEKFAEKTKDNLPTCEFYFGSESHPPCGLYFGANSHPQVTYNYNSSNSESSPEIKIVQSTKSQQENEQAAVQENKQENFMQAMLENFNKTQVAFQGLSNKLESLQNQQGQTQTTSVATQVENAFSSRMQMCLQQSAVHAHSFFDWIQDHKIVCGGLGLVTVYSYILYQLHQAHQILDDPQAFANWQHEKSLEDLFAMPASQIEADLLYTFQHRYVDPCNPLDFNYSLIQSSYALHEEIKVVEKQIWIYRWILCCRVSYLFFIDEQAFVDLQNKYKKLLFMKHVFIAWCAQAKIEKSSKL